MARVRNSGAASALGDVLVFLDVDTVIPEEVLPLIRRVMAAPDCVGGAVHTEYRAKKRMVRAYLGFWRILGNWAAWRRAPRSSAAATCLICAAAIMSRCSLGRTWTSISDCAIKRATRRDMYASSANCA